MKIAPIRLADLARLPPLRDGGDLVGNAETMITGVAPIDHAGAGDLSFLAHARLLHQLAGTPAAAVLVANDFPAVANVRPALIRVANPYFAFIEIVKKFLPGPEISAGIAATATISTRARLGENVSIGAQAIIEAGCEIGEGAQIGASCYLGRDTKIGANTILFPHVCVAQGVTIGRNVIIQFGSVIGSDGFGYIKHEGRYHKIPHLGAVVIEDEVEIGANCTIDRGTFGQTHIGRGVKLDNLIHVAHNVAIGENTVIAAQTGISGSTTIGRDVTIAGQVGITGHIEVGDRVTFGAQAGVTKSIPANSVVSGYPARNHAQARREEAAIRRLPDLLKRVKVLERLLAQNGGIVLHNAPEPPSRRA